MYFNLPDEIIDRLYLGNMKSAENIDVLKILYISHILICASNLLPMYPEEFKYKMINIDDSPTENIKMYFKETYHFIKEGLTTGTGVLVHCAGGISRSTTCTMAYLMKENKMKFEEALNLVKIKHQETYPNTGFIEQLKQYEIELSN